MKSIRPPDRCLTSIQLAGSLRYVKGRARRSTAMGKPFSKDRPIGYLEKALKTRNGGPTKR